MSDQGQAGPPHAAPPHAAPPHAAPSHAVEIRGVRKAFNGAVALDGVSIDVPDGSFFSLLGPSGCGKSTLLRVISGFESPDAGTVQIAGRDMTDAPPNRRPTAMVFQRWALFPHMNVRDNVAYGLRLRKAGKQRIRARVDELLALVGLEEHSAKRPSQLSGGQQQRVALARALAIEPRVLLLDEPLASLDLKLRLQMQLELKRIQREVGTTFVFVTHDQGEAMTMSDAIAVMKDGRVQQIGSPQEIYDEPRSAFVADFIGDTNLLELDEPVRDGRMTVGGRTFAAPARSAAGGDGGCEALSLRYERVRVGDELDCANVADAAVEEVVFFGGSIRYRVRLDGGGRELVAEVPRTGVETPYPIGAKVRVGWDPDAAIPLAS
ncbi:ABC transporter ATP-binding protein [Actinomadura sp. KC06]|uniref:ABC transporter ATP-binding protein n=1 Tax=Actinomadura sp. KC06 TaxID=2530369 RepID=UPI001050C811|nr:ABC transporter ATP-binding protein [Actinomadura sp. KC06]TDD40179.1 ABC transporter ATP-binding protein [Actinomadura sp. KC06]